MRKGIPVYGFIYDYGRDNLLQGGKDFGAIEGLTPVQTSEDLVNEKLTFCMHFPIPTDALDSLRESLQIWRSVAQALLQLGFPMLLRDGSMVALNTAPNLGTVLQGFRFAKVLAQLFISFMSLLFH